MTQSKSKKLAFVFWIFIAVYILNLIIPLFGSQTYTQRLWGLVSISIGLTSILVLIKEKLPNKNAVIIGVVLAVLAGLIRPLTGIITFVAFLASTRIMEKSEDKVVLLKRPYFLSIILGLVAGLVLGSINLLLAGSTLEFIPSFKAFIVALNPGISEEIIYRFFIYAFAIYLMGGKIENRKDLRWLYVLMIVPHVLMHFPDTYFVEGKLILDLGFLVVGPVIQIMLFGLPLTFAMLKRDLGTSMVIHTLVDFVRFVFVGLPF